MHAGIIGGASTIGSTFAYTVVSNDPTDSVTLIEKAHDAAWGHATGLTHANYHVSDAPTPEGSGFGEVDFCDTAEVGDLDLDVLVVTAKAPPDDDGPEGERGAREQELANNLALIDAIADQLRGMEPVPVIVVTNPIDRITYRLWDRLGWPRSKFLGFSLAETARIADAIAKRYDVHPNSVYCPTMGEHGEHVVPVFSRAEIDGERVTIPDAERAEIVEEVLEIPFTIADKRGLQDSSRWVTGAGLQRILRHLFTEDATDPLCLSVPLDGEYGFDDGCMSIPVTLTDTGVDRTIEWELPRAERDQLREAHAAIQADVERFD